MSSAAYSFLITLVLFLVISVLTLGFHALILLERILRVLEEKGEKRG